MKKADIIELIEERYAFHPDGWERAVSIIIKEDWPDHVGRVVGEALRRRKKAELLSLIKELGIKED